MADDYQFDDLNQQGATQKPQYAKELHSVKIRTKQRTFFIDLKESTNGKFIKISEKSNGHKSTIMMDAEDVKEFVDAFNEISKMI